jgi:hypothetical protein
MEASCLQLAPPRVRPWSVNVFAAHQAAYRVSGWPGRPELGYDEPSVGADDPGQFRETGLLIGPVVSAD